MSSLWGWGLNTYGKTGNPTNSATYSSPVQVGDLTDWAQISSTDSHANAIKTDGSLWAWGKSTFGSIGDEYNVNRSSPVQLGSDTDWSKASAGYRNSAALRTGGTLWTWGFGSGGTNGHENEDSVSSPTQVGSLTTWSDVSVGDGHMLAVRTDGTLWSWGVNTDGELGQEDDGGLTNRSSPTQVGSLTTWENVFCGNKQSFAIKTDGTLWGWGYNKNGQLGLGNTTDYSSPVQVGSDTDWAKISCHQNDVIALKTGGSLWSWGTNLSGQLGHNNTTSLSEPTQVGASTDWNDAAITSLGHTVATKTDGTLWGWGDGTFGAHGLETTNDFSSPVQIGAQTGWTLVAAGDSHSLALRTLETTPPLGGVNPDNIVLSMKFLVSVPISPTPGGGVRRGPTFGFGGGVGGGSGGGGGGGGGISPDLPNSGGGGQPTLPYLVVKL